MVDVITNIPTQWQLHVSGFTKIDAMYHFCTAAGVDCAATINLKDIWPYKASRRDYGKRNCDILGEKLCRFTFFSFQTQEQIIP